MKESILRIWSDVRDDPEVRVVVITGTGDRHFCTGADVKQIAETGSTPSGGGSVEAIAWSPIHSGVWKPVICAVNGLVAGGGLHFVADADIVIAADHAAFMDTHVNIGQVGAVENVSLTHRMPLGAVLRMTLQGRDYRLTARRAYELGLVDEIVPLADLQATAREIALSIAANSPTAVTPVEAGHLGVDRHAARGRARARVDDRAEPLDPPRLPGRGPSLRRETAPTLEHGSALR